MSTSNSAESQRRAPRVPAPGTVWLQCRRAGSGGAELANGLLDLSAGGLQFLAREPLGVGDRIDVVLRGAALGKPLNCCGEVRWLVELGAGACCAGLRFLEPLPADVLDALLEMPQFAADSERFLFDFADVPRP